MASRRYRHAPCQRDFSDAIVVCDLSRVALPLFYSPRVLHERRQSDSYLSRFTCFPNLPISVDLQFNPFFFFCTPFRRCALQSSPGVEENWVELSGAVDRLGIWIVYIWWGLRQPVSLKVHTFYLIVLQTAPQQPAVCSLLEDVLRNMARVTNKVVIKKVEFTEAVETFITGSKFLRQRYGEKAVKACLAGGPTVLDDALFYLSKTGKVQSSDSLALAFLLYP